MKKNNGGWLKKLPMWDWHKLCANEFPDWEIDPDNRMPFAVDFSIKKGTDKSSHDIAVEFDDISVGNFYYRDFTDSGLPFVDDGEIYRSAFWFQSKSDKELFEKTFPITF